MPGLSDRRTEVGRKIVEPAVEARGYTPGMVSRISPSRGPSSSFGVYVCRSAEGAVSLLRPDETPRA